ncbi:MAG: polynucleotide adenylyltransferase PcnB [Alcanivorax sp.]|nr:polynucleotide adenylyltransferase PcnB [Alcanivorax sp.]
MTRLIGRDNGARRTLTEPVIIPRDQHPISRKQISRAALNVLYGLHEAGFDAFLVGGCLRDILTGIQPKDFDVVTNATPEEIERIFRRARIIGRRFRLVHVRFGPEVIEVATFRALGEPGDSDSSHSREGQILRDNVYGNIEEDALRRDFTVNALYYNIADFTLYDFAGSMQDIQDRTLRLMGDPAQRYREDPVRMIRAVRFAAKLDFTIDPATEAPIHELAPLMQQVPAARLFDEMLKLFLGGHAEYTLELLQDYGLFDALFPATAETLQDSDQRLLEAAMINTDRRLAQDKPVTPAFLFAVLLWAPMRQLMERYIEDGMPPSVALNKASGKVIAEQVSTIAIPRRFSSVVREIWDLQPRLPRRHGNRAAQLVTHPRFRAAYDFLLLREEAGEIPPGLGQWWTDYQAVDEDARDAMAAAAAKGAPAAGNSGTGRKRRRRRRSSGGGGGNSGGGESA